MYDYRSAFHGEFVNIFQVVSIGQFGPYWLQYRDNARASSFGLLGLDGLGLARSTCLISCEGSSAMADLRGV